MLLDVNGGVIQIAETALNLLPTLRAMDDDCDDEGDQPFSMPNIHRDTLEWVNAVVQTTEVPPSWPKGSFEGLCRDEYPEAVLNTFQGRDARLMTMLSDLDFMGGGYFYDLCRIHVANTITKDNWSVDHIKERFQISEGV